MEREILSMINTDEAYGRFFHMKGVESMAESNGKLSFKIENYMEKVVLYTLDELLPQFNCCHCDLCRLDMVAFALNHLPAKYVVTEKGQIYSKLSELQRQFEVDVSITIIEAIKQVSSNPRHKSNIILIGFMAVGKTTIGRLLAPKLGYRFIDSDEEIIKRAEMSIPDIFERYGEKYFRELEQCIIREILKEDDMVLSTGGGAVLDPSGYDLMKRRGKVITLRASMDTLWQRLKNSGNRPMLFNDNPREWMEELYKLREPFYRQAHHQVDIDGKTPQQIVEEIMNL